MIDIVKVIEHFKRGQPTKYDEEKHIPLLINIFHNGEGVMAFCAEALISKTIFYDWLDRYQLFKEAYDYAVNLAGRKWELYPLENKDFNFPYWSTIMRNRFGYGKVKVKVASNKEPLEIIAAAIQGLEAGELSPQEANQVASLAITKINVKNGEPVTNQVMSVRTREELLERVSMLDRVLQHKEAAK